MHRKRCYAAATQSQGVALEQQDLEAMVARATELRMAGRADEAIAIYRAAIEAFPDSVKPVQHLGLMLTQSGQAEEAEPLLRRALSATPDHPPTRFALALALKAMGRWTEAAWYSSARFDVPRLQINRPDFAFPQWRSFDPKGRHILVFPEQGYGDQIQDVRFVDLLLEQGATVTLLAFPPLERLFTDSFPEAAVRPTEGTLRVATPDFWVASSDLPAMLGATPENVPSAPYLRTDAQVTLLPPGFKIGLATRGSPAHTNDARRSLPDAVADRLRAMLPGQVISLHPEDSGAADFADTAALVAQLDLVVSVDTAVAHLAGAMGKRCLTLLPGFNTDWRWLQGGETTPWYPDMSLFYGAPEGDWGGAIAKVVTVAHAAAIAAA